MPIQIQAPDGSIAEFPDGTPDATITAVMAKTFGGPKPKVNTFADIAKSALQGGREAMSAVGDAVLGATTPLGAIQQTFGAAGNLASVMQGHGPANTKPFAGVSDTQSHSAYQPQTTAGQYARTVGNMLPNAVVPGGLVRKTTAVVLPAVLSEAAGQTANAFGAPAPVQTGARLVGGVIGGVGAGANINRMTAVQNTDQTVANVLSRVNPDVADMTTRANAFNSAGVQPTLLDVIGNRGRRLAAAVGVKNDQAGETLQTNANTRSANAKPAVMAATQDLGPNPGTTADTLQSQTRDARSAQAEKDYMGPYKVQVPLQPDTVAALSDEHGRAALRQARAAASARMDTDQVAEIDSLLKMNPPPTSVSAGTLDRVRIAMRNRAGQQEQNGRSDVASGLRSRVSMIDQTLDQVPEIQPARQAYKQYSQALDVLGKNRKDVFSTDPADYQKWLDGLSPQAQEANKVAIRQEILDTLGGQRASSMGSMDQLASSQYARANLKAALGPEADQYLAHVQARIDQARNAAEASPKGGSRTAVLGNDTSNIKAGIGAAASAMRGDVVGLAGKALDWLKTRGVSDADAQAFAQAAVDPSRVDGVIQALSRRYGRPVAVQYLQLLRGPALLGVAAGTTAMKRQDSAAQQ